MKWLPVDCSFGDTVRVRIGSVYHYGIFVSEDEIIAFGLPPVPEYRDRPERLAVVATDADTFSCGSIIEKAVFSFSERRKKRTPAKIVEIARSRIGETGYNIIHNNCEHFVNECVFGVARCTVEEEARRRWLSRPICDVYIAEIGEFARDGAVYPPERDRKIKECGNDALRAAKYADWALLALAAKRSLAVDFEKTVFKKRAGADGAPRDLIFPSRTPGGPSPSPSRAAPSASISNRSRILKKRKPRSARISCANAFSPKTKEPRIPTGSCRFCPAGRKKKRSSSAAAAAVSIPRRSTRRRRTPYLISSGTRMKRSCRSAPTLSERFAFSLSEGTPSASQPLKK